MEQTSWQRAFQGQTSWQRAFQWFEAFVSECGKGVLAEGVSFEGLFKGPLGALGPLHLQKGNCLVLCQRFFYFLAAAFWRDEQPPAAARGTVQALVV